MPMKLEEIRALVLQALRQPGWNQVVGLEIAVGNLKARVLGHPQHRPNFVVDGRAHLESGESKAIAGYLDRHNL